MASDEVFFVAGAGSFGARRVVFYVGEVAAHVNDGRGLS